MSELLGSNFQTDQGGGGDGGHRGSVVLCCYCFHPGPLSLLLANSEVKTQSPFLCPPENKGNI